MRAPLMVSHLLVMLQHASIVTAQPPKPGGDITCTEGQQATGDSSKIGTGTALLVRSPALTQAPLPTVARCPRVSRARLTPAAQQTAWPR